MIFSERYAEAIGNGTMAVDLPESVRDQLARTMVSHNHTVIIPDDVNVSVNSATVLGEVSRLLAHYPTISLPDLAEPTSDARQPLFNLVARGLGENVLDGIELMWRGLRRISRDSFISNINAIFDGAELPWRLRGGECIALNPPFVGSRLTREAFEQLAAGPFAGATAEFHKALREQDAGEVKDAIRDAFNSYESTLKVLTGLPTANAAGLTRAFVERGYLNDLPADAREGFRNCVLMSLPTIRNKLAGHGQGAEVVDVPAAYGKLALQLAAALQDFLTSKFPESRPLDIPEIPPEM